MAKKEEKKPDTTYLLMEFRALSLKKKDIEQQLSDVIETINEKKQEIMDKFEDEGQSSSKLETGETIYIHSQYWARPSEEHTKMDVMQALREVGHGDLITESYNSNTLSGIIREMKKNKEEIPEALAAVIEVEPAYDIRIRGLKLMSPTVLESDEAA